MYCCYSRRHAAHRVGHADCVRVKGVCFCCSYFSFGVGFEAVSMLVIGDENFLFFPNCFLAEFIC